ncbi:MAG: MATE family efflux transporter [Eubacteriales bacterium]|nr:MATE family efflux transporter [Eubacteriales bacterium]
MNENQLFRKELFRIAIPVTLQCLLQSSFGVIDQIMTGQLGSGSIAGIGMGSKFISLFTVLVSAISAAAGIMIAQYVGKKDIREVGRSFFTNFILACLLAAAFTGICLLFPVRIMYLYSADEETVRIAAGYLKIFSLSCIPAAVNSLLSAYLRCMGAAVMPLYTSIASAVMNTVLNYVMIFGKWGCPAMGVNGAAWASVIAQVGGCVLLYLLFLWIYRRKSWNLPFALIAKKSGWMQYAGIIMPILICEFFWSLGENIYAAIYGHIGTQAYAAMTLTNPIQGLMIGALSGVSQAAGIMIGKSLGAKEYEKAYRDSRKLMLYGLAGSLILSAGLIIFSRYYVLIFRVEDSVRLMAGKVLFIFALISPVKVQNMILGGGIIRSGGKTKYVMYIDLIGTWIFGVPLGFLSAFVWDMPIHMVYFILSLEECVRLGISFVVFKRRKWMQSLKA